MAYLPAIIHFEAFTQTNLSLIDKCHHYPNIPAAPIIETSTMLMLRIHAWEKNQFNLLLRGGFHRTYSFINLGLISNLFSATA